jgi:hypothetical protein
VRWSDLTWRIADYPTLDNADVAEHPTPEPRHELPAVPRCGYAELLHTLGTVSISYIEFLTISPVWDGQLPAPPPDDLRPPPRATYTVAVVDAVFVGFSKGRLDILTVFSDADGQRCTKRWSVEIRTSRKQSARALFTVPLGAVQCETCVADFSQLATNVSQPLQVEQFPKGIELARLGREAWHRCGGD